MLGAWMYMHKILMLGTQVSYSCCVHKFVPFGCDSLSLDLSSFSSSMTNLASMLCYLCVPGTQRMCIEVHTCTCTHHDRLFNVHVHIPWAPLVGLVSVLWPLLVWLEMRCSLWKPYPCAVWEWVVDLGKESGRMLETGRGRATDTWPQDPVIKDSSCTCTHVYTYIHTCLGPPWQCLLHNTV